MTSSSWYLPSRISMVMPSVATRSACFGDRLTTRCAHLLHDFACLLHDFACLLHDFARLLHDLLHDFAPGTCPRGFRWSCPLSPRAAPVVGTSTELQIVICMYLYLSVYLSKSIYLPIHLSIYVSARTEIRLQMA